MRITLEQGPSFTIARVALGAGEQVKGEAGAMVAMSGTIDVETRAQGGILKALARSVLASESFFQNTFTAVRGPGEVCFAPPMVGDVRVREMRGDELILTSGAYLASDPRVQFEPRWGGTKSFFSLEGLFLVRVHGTGSLLFTCYGGIVEVDVPREGYVVDTGHVVAFEPTLDYRVSTVGGMKSLFFSGEGLVCRFSGHGKLWLQTRSLDSLVGVLRPYFPRQGSS